jgi:hypothetical protein
MCDTGTLRERLKAISLSLAFAAGVTACENMSTGDVAASGTLGGVIGGIAGCVMTLFFCPVGATIGAGIGAPTMVGFTSLRRDQVDDCVAAGGPFDSPETYYARRDYCLHH